MAGSQCECLRLKLDKADVLPFADVKRASREMIHYRVGDGAHEIDVNLVHPEFAAARSGVETRRQALEKCGRLERASKRVKIRE